MTSNLTKAHKYSVIGALLIILVVASYFILNFLIYTVIGGLTDSYALDDLMVGYTYHIVSFLLGLTLTVLFWRPTLAFVAKNGIPGLVPKESCGVNKPECTEKIQVYLLVTVVEDGKRKQKTFFTGQFPVDKIQRTLFGDGKPKISLLAKRGGRLTLARSDNFDLSSGLDNIALFVKLARKRKTLFHFESVAGNTGSFSSNQERATAKCVYPLVHLGCQDDNAVASLVFSGKLKPMRSLFFSKK